MAATFLGTTGNWGIPQDETGIIITDLSYDYSNQEKTVLDKGGEIIGLAFYQEKVEIKVSGLVKKPVRLRARSVLRLPSPMPFPRTCSRAAAPQ